MRRGLCAALALILLCAVAFADVETTGNVNLRKGPGTQYAIVATVKKGTTLTDLDSIITDERGVDWYWVQYKGNDCWVSSKYAQISGEAGYTPLETYYGTDIQWAAEQLGLTEYEFTGGELENSYYNDDLILLGNSVVECIVVSGEAHSLFGVSLGMKWYDALNCCVAKDLRLLQASQMTITFEREGQTPEEMDSCITVTLDEEGTVTWLDWSTYTSD